MLAVGLSEAEVKPLISRLTQGQVKVACINSPTIVTISGDRLAISELRNTLQKKSDVFIRELNDGIAYDSHHITDIATNYLHVLGRISLADNKVVEFYSSVSGKRLNLLELDAEYWVSNIRNTVQFSESMENFLLMTEKKGPKTKQNPFAVDALIEIGPHSALELPVTQILQHNTKTSTSRVPYISALVRSKNAVGTSQELVSQLLVLEFPLDLRAVSRPLGYKSHSVLVDLPPIGGFIQPHTSQSLHRFTT